ncbi:hypothetical protein J8J14_03015 [Roseomonas sp. SSH11]|uniref:Uncharacterized protein n=1 Tax=Pararoseomonas baculiformis TaxID=2820812 RepID=A0ABS4ABW2_9PROT|nr:hypothetical protein [Pararoseomonas baculiformis]MBP0443739.1 hypothetical protein [Pararoseomonas baculiformis]
MSPIRLFAAGLVAAVVATPAIAQSCLRPAEKAAFEVRSLQSQLMVAALICKQDEQYNSFVRQFQAPLASAWEGMSTHYRRTNGAVGVRMRDNFVTELANVQQMDSGRQGSQFCQNVASLFTAAMAAPKTSEGLASLAVANNLSNPHGRSECSATTPAASSPTPARTERRAAVRRVSTQGR